MAEEAELQELEKEVKEMEAKVMKMRSEGPAMFKSLLEEHLHKLRPLPAVEPALPVASSADTNGESASLQLKLAKAMDMLPELLERINKCTSELDARLEKLQQQKSCQLVFEQPSSEERFVNRI